jgi:DNA-binding CsgD family transcriptional regulator
MTNSLQMVKKSELIFFYSMMQKGQSSMRTKTALSILSTTRPSNQTLGIGQKGRKRLAIFERSGILLAYLEEGIAERYGLAVAVGLCNASKIPIEDMIFLEEMPQDSQEALRKEIQEVRGKIKHQQKVHLTRRERHVLKGILQSWSNKEIASATNMCERTVKFHVSHLLAKFKCHSRLELFSLVPADFKVELFHKELE